MSQPAASPLLPTIAFIGGGNMASAIIGGLVRQGLPAQRIAVVGPFEGSRNSLRQRHAVEARPAAGDFLAGAGLVVWAVKPQSFREAAAAAVGGRGWRRPAGPPAVLRPRSAPWPGTRRPRRPSARA